MSEQNGKPMNAEVFAAESAALERLLAIAEEARPSHWGNAEGLAAWWGNVYTAKTIQNRSAPSVPDEDRIPSHYLSPGGDRTYYFPECDEWLLGRRAA